VVVSNTALQVSRHAQELAELIEKYLEKVTGSTIGFQLFIWPDQVCTYVGNVDRKVAGDEIKRIIASWEQGMPNIPVHEKN